MTTTAAAVLDSSSTSQTSTMFDCAAEGDRGAGTAPRNREKLPACIYNAPLFAVKIETGRKTWKIVQGNCHHWDCPRCGVTQARKNYGRIVEGATKLSQDHGELWFLTITCRGLGLKKADAEAGYLTWTNRLLTALRTNAKRNGKEWAYCQVTERQKRGHPHSHILTTYSPADIEIVERYKYQYGADGKRHRVYYDAHRSKWFGKRVITAGLGDQYDIQVVESVEACSRYIAKYLFKDTMLTKWPKGWKRVRYSQSWPKLPEREKTDAYPLITDDNWREFLYAEHPLFLDCRSVDSIRKIVLADRFIFNDVQLRTD